MSSELREIVTGPITHEQIKEELTFIAALLTERQVTQVIIKHWFGQTLVSVSEIVDVLVRGLKQEGTFLSAKGPVISARTVHLGDSDFTITSTAATFLSVFKICHEDEIHCYSSDEELLSTLLNRWAAKGYAVRER